MPKSKNIEFIKRLKDNAKNLGIFPNLEVFGSYDDFSQLVIIDYLDEKEFFKLLQVFQPYNTPSQTGQRIFLQKDYQSITRFFSTCVHEFTHWLDHTSTLWGQKQLILIYNAINAWTNKKEDEFWRIMIANSERHRARLATYYTEEYRVDQQESAVIPWQYQYGAGLEFGIDGRSRTDRPFVYTIFSKHTGQKVCRVPFSMFSLTESNATYAEFKVKFQNLELLNDDSRLVERCHLNQEILQNLYNSKLTIYSVATHCLANFIGITEIFKAYEFSSALATLCLNIPKSLFPYLVEVEDFSVFGEQVQALKDLADPGFAFFVIAKCAPKYYDSLSVKNWLEEALRNAGLPNLATILSMAYTQMKELENEVLDGRYSTRLRSLLSIGRRNFTRRGVWGQNVLSIENLQSTSMTLPPIILGDGFVTPVTSKTIQFSQEDMEQWIDQVIDIEVSLNQFVQACRY